MKRCIIIGAYKEAPIRSLVCLQPEDFIVCADGGYHLAQQEKIIPNLVVGDFDSFHGTIPAEIPVITVPVEKDDTDTMLCLKEGIRRGCEEFILLGCLGGRLDHTMANLQALAYGYEQGCFVLLADSHNLVTMMGEETVEVPRVPGYKLSVFAYTPVCSGVTERGVKYRLTNATLTNNFPLGVSNEFEEETAVLTCKEGRLLIVLSTD